MQQLPALTVVGGCCGTDRRHVAEVCSACARVEIAHCVLGELGVVLDGGLVTGEGSSVAGARGVGKRERPLARGGRHRGGQSSVRAFARM